jgi:hypothetical protein
MTSEVSYSNISKPDDDPQLSGLDLFKSPKCNATIIDYYTESRILKKIKYLKILIFRK